jgi:hypothetical protein
MSRPSSGSKNKPRKKSAGYSDLNGLHGVTHQKIEIVTTAERTVYPKIGHFVGWDFNGLLLVNNY